MPVKQPRNTFKMSVDTPLYTIDISLIKADILAACIKEVTVELRRKRKRIGKSRIQEKSSLKLYINYKKEIKDLKLCLIFY